MNFKVAVLTLALLTTPLAAEAQEAGYRIGMLWNWGPGGPDYYAFLKELHESFGYVAGQNLVIEHRGAAGHLERLPDLAAELVRLNLDVIVSWG